jgi:hypothetical protein
MGFRVDQDIKISKGKVLYVTDHISIYRKLSVMEWDSEWLYVVSGLV